MNVENEVAVNLDEQLKTFLKCVPIIFCPDLGKGILQQIVENSVRSIIKTSRTGNEINTGLHYDILANFWVNFEPWKLDPKRQAICFYIWNQQTTQPVFAFVVSRNLDNAKLLAVGYEPRTMNAELVNLFNDEASEFQDIVKSREIRDQNYHVACAGEEGCTWSPIFATPAALTTGRLCVPEELLEHQERVN